MPHYYSYVEEQKCNVEHFGLQLIVAGKSCYNKKGNKTVLLPWFLYLRTFFYPPVYEMFTNRPANEINSFLSFEIQLCNVASNKNNSDGKKKSPAVHTEIAIGCVILSDLLIRACQGLQFHLQPVCIHAFLNACLSKCCLHPSSQIRNARPDSTLNPIYWKLIIKNINV